MPKGNTSQGKREKEFPMARKSITLSKNAKKFDAALLSHDAHVTAFLSQPKPTGTALALIPGEGVIDLTPARKPTPKMVTLRCPVGTKETPLYVITPEMGGKPRWFEKRLLSAWVADGDSYLVTLAERGVKERKLTAYIA
jgi:hypothetical protein